MQIVFGGIFAINKFKIKMFVFTLKGPQNKESKVHFSNTALAGLSVVISVPSVGRTLVNISVEAAPAALLP